MSILKRILDKYLCLHDWDPITVQHHNKETRNLTRTKEVNYVKINLVCTKCGKWKVIYK